MEQIKQVLDAAYAAFVAEPNKANRKKLKAAIKEFSCAAVSPASNADGGGTGNGPPNAP